MSTSNICFCGEIRKISLFFWCKKFGDMSHGLYDKVYAMAFQMRQLFGLHIIKQSSCGSVHI